MRIKKTLNILLILIFAFFVTSCFQKTGPQQSGLYKLPEGNYGGYIYACERENMELLGGRMGYVYQDRKYYYMDKDDVEITIYYGFIIKELLNVLEEYNIEIFTYQISAYAFHERTRINILNLLKTEEIIIENEELLKKYECIKEVLEYQEPMYNYNGAIYKYSYTSEGTIEYKINTETIMYLFDLYRSNIDSVDVELALEIIIDENTKFTICNTYIRFFNNKNEITFQGTKHN